MQLIQEPYWPGLTSEHRLMLDAAWDRFRHGDFQEAAKGFDAAYRLLLEAQPEGHRFHKGESLHNKGLALLWAGDREESLRATLAAFVEDAASLAEESPRLEELDRPAAHNLIYVFGLAGPPLAAFASQVRALVSSGGLLPDPHALLVTEAAAEAATPPPGTRPPRIIGVPDPRPERRVFIGGWYGRLVGALRPLRDHLESIDYDGIVVADFGVPAGRGEDEIELALLTNCHYAVFEVSESAGQIEEIRDVPETMRTPERVLAVFDRNHGHEPGISRGQTLVKLRRWNVEPVGYSDLGELFRVVEAWLTGSS